MYINIGWCSLTIRMFFLLKAFYRSGQQTEDNVWDYLYELTYQQFVIQYPESEIELDSIFRQHVTKIVGHFESTGSVQKVKSSGHPTQRTDGVVDDVKKRIEQSPTKSVRKLAAQSGISSTTAHRILKKDLHMTTYKFSVVQELHPADYQQRIDFCHWFRNNMTDGKLNLTFFTDEAWFHLSGYVNSQNYRTWSTDNPHSYMETSLHLIKIRIWVALSRKRIIGLIFCEETVTAAKYQQIIAEFVEELHDDELQNGYF